MNSSFKRLTWAALTAAALASQLTGCFPLVAGGAVMTGFVATDRRTSGAQVEDEGIELRAVNRVHEALGDGVHLNVTSYNRQVLLTGEATTAEAKQKVEQIVSRVENVRGVHNEMVVGLPSSLSDRSNDALISGKVKASLVDARDLISNAFKVVTERRVVYLMGRVTQREANRATEIARGVDGVQKVVRVFEVISEEELKRQLPSQPDKAEAAQVKNGS
ncbi:BON domain-containing protein [Curvibacter sp. RS43]|uniref:BON domain-containing protein n=1 Tax=Curvibacter microcysteis TaxID=3026419 RepID=A0ABT5MER6_9BURK|nr:MULTISPECIES: BON domain-containing protein [unclassified Curvibacter]MDD0812417.1 BON domain-containing protein [Curvibacter sp. RS43]MDD0813660.1 BON domain-containing protein [Curvibacter sp. HBC28]